ncbi:hypothetical protein L6452_22424 [Arctium lappa]|uniref:Uncharacterized protein n=1 Tax=Arctium lappa TaxID=4217 RepID=A0ACB9AZ56_ARCLA|nr:hypothetical protein L6452_22424 [Arctium lappa]
MYKNQDIGVSATDSIPRSMEEFTSHGTDGPGLGDAKQISSEMTRRLSIFCLEATHVLPWMFLLCEMEVATHDSGLRDWCFVVAIRDCNVCAKAGTNQVQKVEVDGVHIMFKLKQEHSTLESDMNSGSSSTISQMQDSELLLRIVAPTKRIVYTTTRPNDIKTSYEKMLENDVEFGSSDKSS